MPRLQLTDKEAALIEAVRKDRTLVISGLLQAKKIVEEQDFTATPLKDTIIQKIETAIKELR